MLVSSNSEWQTPRCVDQFFWNIGTQPTENLISPVFPFIDLFGFGEGLIYLAETVQNAV
jgi:hypothetical protein